MMKRIWIMLTFALLASCQQPQRELKQFPSWVQGSWQAELREGDVPLSMIVSKSGLGFAVRTNMPEPSPVQVIVKMASGDLLVTPAESGWKHRFTRQGAFVDVYDIRFDDKKEFLRARFRRK